MAIINDGPKVDCQPIIDWLWVALISKSGDDQPPPLAMPRPIVPLMERDFLQHIHNGLVRHLSVSDLALQYAQGFLISTHIGNLTIELFRNQELKSWVKEQYYNKIFPDFLRTNMTYLLRLEQVVDH